MKKIVQKIKLRKFGSHLSPEAIEQLHGTDFMVVYYDGSWERAYFTTDLVEILRNDHIKKVLHIFDMADRIVIDRDVLIDIKDIIGGRDDS